jgi:hypothetical protein
MEPGREKSPVVYPPTTPTLTGPIPNYIELNTLKSTNCYDTIWDSLNKYAGHMATNDFFAKSRQEFDPLTTLGLGETTPELNRSVGKSFSGNSCALE